MKFSSNFTLPKTNSTVLYHLLNVTKSNGFIAGICLFILFLLGICLLKRIHTIRNSKTALKKRFTKITDMHFEDDVGEYKPSKLGDISFAIDYLFGKNILVVNVMQVFGLTSPSNVEIDSYVKVRIEPESWNIKPRKTKIQHQTNNPTFSKKFQFRILKSELENAVVILEVFDHDIAGAADSMLGIMRFPISLMTHEEFQNLPCEKKLPLDPPTESHEGNGEICIVLRHFPIEHLLKVTVLEIKRLHFKSKTKILPIYVSVEFYFKNELLETKYTTTKYNTRDPYFSETFEYHLKPVKAPYVYLLFKVFQKPTIGLKKCLGKLEIGSNSPTLSAQNHWMDMVAYPRVAKSCWHALSKDESKD